jgi:NAD(P)-dependent dehydrogenase (short-subunit alcohol dehydrogenase family)
MGSTPRRGRLEGQVALVTGSTRGIGRVTAEIFAAEGARVVVTGRTVDDGRTVEKRIRAAGGEALYVATDVEQEGDIEAAIAEAVRAFGSLTVLVNNAAPTDLMQTGLVDGSVTDLTTERWRKIMLGTLDSAFWACKYAIPEMTRAGGGAIVNIASSAATRGWAGIDAYTAAKAGLLGLTRSIATEYAGQAIRCNAITVGMVPHVDGEEVADSPLVPILRKVQLTRLGRADDIAHAAAFLASEDAGFITGVVLPVDGGLTSAIKLDVSETLRGDED